jgi:hypothetical protein
MELYTSGISVGTANTATNPLGKTVTCNRRDIVLFLVTWLALTGLANRGVTGERLLGLNSRTALANLSEPVTPVLGSASAPTVVLAKSC